MKSWEIHKLELKPRLPEILSSTDVAGAVVLDLEQGESLRDHEVHERAWLVVLAGEIEVSTTSDEHRSGGVGFLVEFVPRERHEVVARSKTRLLLLLTPWPGHGHPGAMTITQKLYARRHAAKKRELE
jgi:hypothetical protein